MKSNIISLKAAALILLAAITGTEAAPAAETACKSDYATGRVRDLALIYQGNKRRPAWTQEDFVPYLTHKFADGHRDWTFDGFLFLEFDNGEGVSFQPSLGKMATKADWQWYLDKLFEEGKSLDALDKCIDRMKAEIGDPGFKHKIVLTIMTPYSKTVNWGEVDGKELDFTDKNQAALAAKWYIDEMVNRFHSNNYKNLELTGLYWLDEDMCHTFDLAKYIEPYVHAHNLEYIWIPYYNARGLGTWRELGFDIVYQQAGYAFGGKHHLRLRDVTDLSRGLGLGLEFEMDDNSLYEREPVSNYNLMRDYIDWFEETGVWERSGVAYYTDNNAIKKMSESTQEFNKRLLDRLFGIIVERRNNPNLIKK